jgi:3-oxoacyl-[acyl-carrier protein] reductase
MGEQGIVFPANVCDEQEISTMVEKVTEEYKRIDVLVHCAAIYPQAPISSLTLNEWKEVIEVNLTGTFVVLKACAAVMKRFQSGRVILISSVAGETVGLPHYSHYASSKAGMNGLMRTAALELAKYNIMVNSISPGNILNQSAYPVGEERVEAMLKRIPLGRLGNPRDIAEIALFLGSDKASFITGQSIVVDGGQSILPGIL